MRIVFADTGYWIALVNPDDDLHHKAIEISKTLSSVYIVTSEMVLTEVLNDFSKRGDFFRQAAIDLIENLIQNHNVSVVPQTSVHFWEGILLYKQRPDKRWSLTDCVSFRIMQEYGIIEALAYDKHFEQAGFKALLRD